MEKDFKKGIMDPEGINNNPINDLPYSEEYKELAKKWSQLPAYKKAKEILKTIANNQVTLVISSTGSGKSVMVPKFVLHLFDYDKNKKIAMTLPKQITAKSSAEFAAKTLDVKLGEEIGYQYKGSDKKSKSDKTILLYATDGTIVSRLLRDPSLKDFDCVIIDEAHERKVQIDFLLYLLRKTLELRSDFKVIIMSATINAHIFASYFSKFKFKTMDIAGETNYPIESIFLTKSITDKEYLDKGYEIIKKITKEDKTSNPGAHDIIFFTPSVADAMDLCRRCTQDKLDIYCIEVYSGMDRQKEELALDKDKYKLHGKSRKLLMATGVAESSLTFPGIKYVIDSGYEFSDFWDPEINVRVLAKKFITNAQAKQRMGRAGRTEMGICYHLYTKDDFENKMEKYPEPNIRTSNIYQECLKLLSYPNISTVQNLITVLKEFIEPPKEKYVMQAITQLTDLGLTNSTEITNFGRIINEIQFEPTMAIAVYASKMLRCSKEVLIIMSVIESAKKNIGELFNKPKDNKAQLNKFNKQKSKFAHKSGDHLSIYTIINSYITMKKENPDKINKYVYDHFLKTKVLDKAYKNYKTYRGSLFNLKTQELEEETLNGMDLEKRILACVAFGFKINQAYARNGSYSTDKLDKLSLNRDSFLTKMPNKIVYNELFSGSAGRVNINISSEVNKKIEDIVSILDDKIDAINKNLDKDIDSATSEDSVDENSDETMSETSDNDK